MPLLISQYRSPAWVGGRHAQTIFPNLFRKVKGVHYDRERVVTFDQDFLDIDWSCIGSSKLVILSHGLEGHTSQQYILGMVRTINKVGWDAMAWNFRGCSGEMNNKVRFYHAGSTEDLDWVIQHAIKQGKYKEIVLIGFSLGGSITLKLLGERGSRMYPEISKALTFSVPGNLQTCIRVLSNGFNRIYLNRFLNAIKNKLIAKIKQYPDLLSHVNLEKIQCFEDFDNCFTVPLWGYKDAQEYYEICSSNKNIPDIRVPTLIVNAQNDPFFHPTCYPVKECEQSRWVHLELPTNGGHLGFMLSTINGLYWSEERAIEFLKAS